MPHEIPLLLSMGCLNIDLNAKLNTPVGNDARLMSAGFHRYLGGMAANVACAAKALGQPYPMNCGLLAPCGNDRDGDWLRQQLTEKSINITWLDDSEQAKTHYCLILVDPDGKRMLISEPTSMDIGKLQQALKAKRNVQGAKLLYIDGFHAAQCHTQALQARQTGWHTAMDMDELADEFWTGQGITSLLQAYQLVFVNQTSAERLMASSPSQCKDWLDFFQPLCDRYQNILLLTQGADGAHLLQPNAPAEKISTLTVDVVDTTGAGDICAGVFLTLYGHGIEPLKAAHYACAAASLSITRPGALTWLPTAVQIQEVLSRRCC